jgi:hypothetical protein
VIHIKILSLGDPERYAVRRLVIAAERELQAQFPGLQLHIQEVDQASEIGKYAQVLVLPTLVINEKVVCSGRYPGMEEIVAWLKAAVRQK